MATLREVTIVLDDQEQFVAASARWEVKSVVDGISIAGGATTAVGTKAITDVAEDVIAAVIAEGPQFPVETP